MKNHFKPFRENTIGHDLVFETPYGQKKMIYADWIASGRLYRPIEETLVGRFGPFVGNTHTETSETGTVMTRAYHDSHEFMKQSVNADKNDVIITAGFGMTAVVNKLQRILGLRIPEKWQDQVTIPKHLRPIVFITHMEHHSNHTSWLETIAEVQALEPDENGHVDLDQLEEMLKKYRKREFKIGAFTACSNVTGICTPYHEMAKLMHEHGGVCFVDFAASAPYVQIDMHPKDPLKKLDAVYFSPHKFLGGPGSPGVLIFDSSLYSNRIPDNPGGGTVSFTNPWNLHQYISDIEAREDGGTPGFLQSIRAALAMKLKREMEPEKILDREERLLSLFFRELDTIDEIHILEDHIRKRLAVVSFYVEKIHYNLMVQLLNDRFGIQARGGCSCAGTYGHYLLHLSPRQSRRIARAIARGNLSTKPGWVRISLHPTMTEEEVGFIANAIREIIRNRETWEKDYEYDPGENIFVNRKAKPPDSFLPTLSYRTKCP